MPIVEPNCLYYLLQSYPHFLWITLWLTLTEPVCEKMANVNLGRGLLKPLSEYNIINQYIICKKTDKFSFQKK